MRFKTWKIAALCMICGLSPGRAFAANKHITPEMDRLTMQGLDAIYEMDFDAAEAEAHRVVALAPEHPLGYFALSAVEFVRFVYDTEQTDQKLIATFEKRMAVAIKKSEAWVKKHPNDSMGLMYMSSSYGLWSRLMVHRKAWLRAYWYGRKSVKIMRKAIEADPENYDAYLCIGTYDYYTDVYPHFIGVLAKIVLRGNRERGIKTIQLVAEKGRYTQTAAKLLLVEIYTMDRFGSKAPDKAVEIMDGIRRRYPGSAMLHGAQLIALYENKRYDQVLEGASVFHDAVKTGKYRPLDAAKGYVIQGTAYWAKGKLEEAATAFSAGSKIRLGKQLSRWSVWSMIRAGQVADLLARHEQARQAFKTAAKEPDYWGMRAAAKAHVRKPYEKEGYPGPIYHRE